MHKTTEQYDDLGSFIGLIQVDFLEQEYAHNFYCFVGPVPKRTAKKLSAILTIHISFLNQVISPAPIAALIEMQSVASNRYWKQALVIGKK